MKHVKLFEAWSDETDQQGSENTNLALLVARGDWSKILIDPSRENVDLNASWIPPSTYIVTYYANPNPDELEDYASDLEEAIGDIFGGDQSGGNLSPKFLQMHNDPKYPVDQKMDEQEGILRIIIDGSLDPMEIKSGILDYISKMDSEWTNETDLAEEILNDGEVEPYTDEYLNYLKGVMQGETSIFPRELVFEVK
jgi:hypothetical protein